MNIFMTGSLGAIGSPLLKRLLFDGHEVWCLVRGTNEEDASKRMRELIGFNPKCHVIRGDITEHLCGISNQTATELRKKVKWDVMLHAAAFLKMEEKYAEQASKTNVIGTSNVTSLMTMVGIPRIFYVSTAYVENGESNSYERTKALAEALIRNSGHPHTTARTSIVIGDSITGEISRYHGMTGFFLPFHEMAMRFREKLELKESDDVELPVLVESSKMSRLNLIPLDWTVDMLAKLVVKPANPNPFHIIHPSPPFTRWVIRTGTRLLGISGIRFDGPMATGDYKMAQRMISGVIRVFDPYVRRDVSFCNEHLQAWLGADYVDPPEIDEVLMERCFAFAIAHNFGREQTSIERIAEMA